MGNRPARPAVVLRTRYKVTFLPNVYAHNAAITELVEIREFLENPAFVGDQKLHMMGPSLLHTPHRGKGKK